jgi:hypothetical protein
MKDISQAVARRSRRLGRVTFPLGIRRAAYARAARGTKDAVFIWIPRTAGTSIWTMLESNGCPKLKDTYAIKHCFAERGLVTFGHVSYRYLLESGLVTPEFDRRAFKFTFVRNPFDRAVSLFHFLKRQRYLHANVSFRTFAGLLEDKAFDPVGPYNLRGLSQCNCQTDWLKGADGKLHVDFIGRWEHLAEDAKELAAELGVAAELPHLNSTDRGDYRAYYDDETRDIVARAYAEDLTELAYEF